MALALVFIQVTEAQEPKVKTIKKLYTKCIEDKHEEILCRMGAILGTGIINACGRNASISLMTRDGQLRQNAIIGMVMFLQYWYWYPLLNFVTLAMTPTTLIGLNEDLKVPKSFKFVSDAKPSNFAYPEMLKKEEKKSGEKVETAVLSTTSKVKARKDRKDKAEGRAETPTPDKNKDQKMEDANEKPEDKKEDEEKKNEEEKKEEKEEEPEF
jgi:26S proteasome regulatory subunit N2